MRLLCFGDPEGLLQRRKTQIQKIIEKHKPDFVIFLGDYCSNQITYYNKLSRYKHTSSLYDLFPEAILIKNIESKYNYIFVYGNKDIRPNVLRLSKEKLRRKLENWYFVKELKGEIKKLRFYILNGSYTIPIASSTLKELFEYIQKQKKKYKVKGSLWKAKKQIRKIIINNILKTFGKRNYNLLFGLYLTNFEGLPRIKTNSNILLTHTPPYLKNSNLLFGNYPDIAIYKKIDENTITPVYEDDPEAIKENVGEQYITNFILKNNFNLVLCGHIHEGSGVSLIKETNTLVVNPGSIAAFQNKNKIIPFTLINIKENNIIIYIKSWIGEREMKVQI